MKQYYLFLDKPVGLHLDKNTNRLVVKVDDTIITNGTITSLIKQVEELNNYLQKYYATKAKEE